MSRLRWIEDPGHGWLVVPLADYPDAIESGTGYGYIDATSIYLEEDVEAVDFLNRHPEINGQDLPSRYVGRVKAPDLFGQVHDTRQTESPLNGWRDGRASSKRARSRQPRRRDPRSLWERLGVDPPDSTTSNTRGQEDNHEQERFDDPRHAREM